MIRCGAAGRAVPASHPAGADLPDQVEVCMEHANRIEIVAVDEEASFWDDDEVLRRCLQEVPPRIPPHFGYDELGSELFEAITELPTYHLTRVEHGLLQRHAAEIARRLDSGWIAELGSGSAKKTRLLLAACVSARPTTYLPIDVSREMLVESATRLTAELGALQVRALWGRYEAGLAALVERNDERLALAVLGSNLGNTTAAERAGLLTAVADTLRSGDRLLISADLAKSAAKLEECYNDPPGREAFVKFRLNHLTHLNRRFDGDFELRRFRAHAHYNAQSAVVEGHLYATEDHSVELRRLGVRLHLRVGDSINVGYSAKFERDRFVEDLSRFGFTPDAQWIDEAWQYGIFLLVRR
jgi:L-histidine N-alpha-methyltransferase